MNGAPPQRWPPLRLRRALLRLEQGWSPSCHAREAEGDEWGVLKAGCVNGGRFVDIEHKALPPEEPPLPELEVRPGDLLMSRANTRELLGSVALVPRGCRPRLLLCDKLFRLSIDERFFDKRFLVYAMASAPARAQLEAGATGSSASMQNIGQASVKDLDVPAPSTSAQRAVARLLDRKTAAIDALIEKKESLAALIEERRQATICTLVTKGIDPATRTRDSGHDWIGPIPAHWDVARTRHVARLESGHTPSRQHPEYWVAEECTIPWVSLADVWQIREGRVDVIRETAEKVSPLGVANSAARVLPAGTVIVSRTASVGFSAIIAEPMATTQDFVNWICGPRLRPKYLLYVFRAMRDEFRRLTMGSTHQTIYMPDVARFVTPVPPLDEQDAIVGELTRRLASIDELTTAITREIDKLREYRQALITAAVTGQLGVAAQEAA